MKRSKFGLSILSTLLILTSLFATGCGPQNVATVEKVSNVEKSQYSSECTAKIPKTNAEIRLWYNDQVVIIPILNKRWIEEGITAKRRAEKAFEIRHQARINARSLMRNRDEVENLRKRDMKKYGNPDGPTFQHLVKLNHEKGFSGNQIYENIVESSSRTSPEYNKRFGIKRESE